MEKRLAFPERVPNYCGVKSAQQQNNFAAHMKRDGVSYFNNDYPFKVQSVSLQSDQVLRCPFIESLDAVEYTMYRRTKKVLFHQTLRMRLKQCDRFLMFMTHLHFRSIYTYNRQKSDQRRG